MAPAMLVACRPRAPPCSSPAEGEPTRSLPSVVAGRGRLGSQFRLVRQHFTHNAQRMFLALARRDVLLDVAMEQGQPDFVVIERGGEGK